MQFFLATGTILAVLSTFVGATPAARQESSDGDLFSNGDSDLFNNGDLVLGEGDLVCSSLIYIMRSLLSYNSFPVLQNSCS